MGFGPKFEPRTYWKRNRDVVHFSMVFDAEAYKSIHLKLCSLLELQGDRWIQQDDVLYHTDGTAVNMLIKYVRQDHSEEIDITQFID